MGKTQKLITITLWAVLITALVGVVTAKLLLPRPGTHQAGSSQPSQSTGDPLPVLYPAATFALTDQDGRPFSSDRLRGRPWVCGFIFTTCGDVCPRLTGQMAGLQHKLPAGAQLVSFSVNPEHDTPAVLKEYATTWKADESRWHFLTGTPELMSAAAAGMNMAAKPAEGEQPILHDRRLLLVDAAGNVRGVYSSADDAAMARLVTDAQAVAKEPPAAGKTAHGGVYDGAAAGGNGGGAS